MFWGDEDEERARHSLSDVLSHLRRVLGRDAIGARSEVIELDTAGRLSVDAVEFESAVETRNWARAAELYGGELLADFYIERSPAFEDWLTRERARCARLFIQTCENALPVFARNGDWPACRALASRWLAADPKSSEAAQYLLRGAAGLPDRAATRATLSEYEANATRLDRDFGVKPDPRVATLAAQLGDRLAAERMQSMTPPEMPALLPAPMAASATVSVAPLPPVMAPVSVDATSRDAHRLWTRRGWQWAAAAAVVILAVAGASALRLNGAARDAMPVVAVTDIGTTDGDTTITWLREGLREMLANYLAHGSSVAVVAPSTIRDLIKRAGWATPLDVQQQADLARRVHATWAVSGIVSKDAGGYTMDVTVREVASGQVVQRYAVSGSDVIAVTGQAATFVLGVAGDRASGPHLSDVETGNIDAFRHFADGVNLETRGDFAGSMKQYDAAIAADSAFVSAIVARIRGAQVFQDRVTYARLKPILDRSGSRVTEWDRLGIAAYDALHGGEHVRAEQLAREMVARFPRDPRAYQTLADTYDYHGKIAAADSILVRLLSLDSLAIAAGTGPCAPCEAYGRLIDHSAGRGDLREAEHLARRWTELQPSLATPWLALAAVLSFDGRYEPAFAAIHRAQALEPRTSLVGIEARTAIIARRLDRADSIMKPFADDNGNAGSDALDIIALVQRERGQPRASVATYERLQRKFGGALDIVAAHTLGQLGDLAAARRIVEDHQPVGQVGQWIGEMRSDDARAFAWHHALEADAIAEYGDTTMLRILADSIQLVGAVSYYGRDWRLYHHVRGLIAMRAARYEDAVREFEQARWQAAGWTRTNVEIARAQLALHRPDRAIAVLRDAYKGPEDAMGRYVPRSELDYWMAQGFQQAGRPDSAFVYAALVRRAWAEAEPEVKRRLVALR